MSTEVSPEGIIIESATASGARTLYQLTADTPVMSNCTAAGGCDGLWPPLLTKSRALAGTGASRGLIGTIRRSDGTYQVTYDHHPVYFFALDLAAGATAGETNGEHIVDPAPIDGVWSATLPNGAAAPGTATVQSESSGGATILADEGAVTDVVATPYALSSDTPAQSNCTALWCFDLYSAGLR